MSHWRDSCRPIIAKVIEENKHLDEKAIRRALYNAYPFGERRMYPYKVWLSEIAVQLEKRKTYWHLGRKKKDETSKDQLTMF